MSIVKVFTKDTLLEYINDQQTDLPEALTEDSVTLSSPMNMTGSTNTQIAMSGTGKPPVGGTDVYVGQVQFQYNRLALETLFAGISVRYEREVSKPNETLYDWLDTFSEEHGVLITQDDVTDLVLGSSEGETVRVYAKPGSLNFTGYFDIRFKDEVNIPNLDTLNPVLDIYFDNITPSDFKYGTVDGELKTLPFNGARLTTGVDFTDYWSYLDELSVVDELSNPVHQEMVSKILLSEFGIRIGPFDNKAIIVSLTKTEFFNHSIVYLKVPGAKDYLVFDYWAPAPV